MSRLLNSSESFRQTNKARNIYNQDDTYNVGNSRALSDGDERGRGELNGVVGTATDIFKRSEAESRNLYGKNNPYTIENA